jgi:hypothetical protein
MEEVSKSTLAVMMLLALLVSVVSTITVLKVINEPYGTSSSGKAAPVEGNVVLTIEKTPEPSYGQVSLSIKTGDS